MDVEEKVKSVFQKVLDIQSDEIKLDDKLENDLGIDSTEMVEISVALKKEFGVEVGDNELKKSHSFNEIVGILKGKGAV
ncbi:hypothetical protein MNBD_UNCLBAC01-687 [hydrothermal vent metagenome]|uniref:Carrier domain-containing protein n=1 Tax=hydrothermal vent metagenome TaxID=652676 RepID=A0A3B1CWC5_9ZZZZ